MASISPGSHLGPYEVGALIGRGGMGEVYRAHDSRLDRPVALKVLTPAFSNDAGRLARFTQEARTTALLNHPNIIAVYDVGTDQGIPFVVSELLDGETLRSRLRRGTLTVRKAVALGLELARGLIAAHRLGIVHRDLKPENVFLTGDGRVKILDFGLAICRRAPLKKPSPDSSTTGGRGWMVGTIGYAAPEQIRGADADHRSDVFSVGVMLYEMIAGAAPFHAVSSIDAVVATLREDPPRLADKRAVPRALDDVVQHCLEKDPSNRFQSAIDLAFSLESVLHGATAGARVLNAWPYAVRAVLRQLTTVSTI